jgi:hypothetical protein
VVISCVPTEEILAEFSNVGFLGGQICDFPSSSVRHTLSKLVCRRFLVLQPLSTAMLSPCGRHVVITRFGGFCYELRVMTTNRCFCRVWWRAEAFGERSLLGVFLRWRVCPTHRLRRRFSWKVFFCIGFSCSCVFVWQYALCLIT